MKLTNEQKNEIKEQQSQKAFVNKVSYESNIRRSELEKILYEATPVLDHEIN